LDRAIEANPGDAQFARISKAFEDNEDNIRRAVEARSRERLRNLTNTLDSRKEQEVKDITSVLDELARAIEGEFKKDEEPEQFELFSPDERTQVTRDNEALEARLARIPREKEQEIDIIHQRYRDFTDRTFPVAVIFLVPESMLGGV
jgi:hypothetical protein